MQKASTVNTDQSILEGTYLGCFQIGDRLFLIVRFWAGFHFFFADKKTFLIFECLFNELADSATSSAGSFLVGGSRGNDFILIFRRFELLLA